MINILMNKFIDNGQMKYCMKYLSIQIISLIKHKYNKIEHNKYLNK